MLLFGCVRGRSLPFPPLEVGPLNQPGGVQERCKLPSGVRGGAPAEIKYGARWSCQKATGGNYFEYSVYHVLQ